MIGSDVGGVEMMYCLHIKLTPLFLLLQLSPLVSADTAFLYWVWLKDTFSVLSIYLFGMHDGSKWYVTCKITTLILGCWYGTNFPECRLSFNKHLQHFDDIWYEHMLVEDAAQKDDLHKKDNSSLTLAVTCLCFSLLVALV